MAPAVVVGLSLISTGIAVHSQQEAAKAERKSARRRAEALSKEAGVERERARRLASSQMASFGAGGVTAAGTPTMTVLQGLFDSIDEQEAILAGARNALAEGRDRARARELAALREEMESAKEKVRGA